MRTASADSFLKSARRLEKLLRKVKKEGVHLTGAEALASVARNSVAKLRKYFLMMQRDYPVERYPKAAFQIGTLRSLVDGILGFFPAKPDEMLRLVDALLLVAESDLAAELDAEETSSAQQTDTFLPDDLVDSKLGVFLKVLWEINRCYNAACYNACATMIRRLIEGLIVEAFEKHGEGNKIRDAAGDYLAFGDLIGKAAAGTPLRLTRNTKAVLPSLKFLGDFGAHNRLALLRKGDLDRIHDPTRAAIEELNRMAL